MKKILFTPICIAGIVGCTADGTAPEDRAAAGDPLAPTCAPFSLDPAGGFSAKEGLVDCNNASAHALCRECGWGAAKDCCPSGWTCTVLCSKWVDVKDDKGNIIGRYCATGA